MGHTAPARLSVDALGPLTEDEDEVSPDPVAQAHARCRERLGPLGVPLPWFEREVAAALDGKSNNAEAYAAVIDQVARHVRTRFEPGRIVWMRRSLR